MKSKATNAQCALEKVTKNNKTLPTISKTLYVLGGIAIVVGLICFINGCSDLDTSNEIKRMAASATMCTGLASIISGICFSFFGAIGNCINEIRNYAAVDFSLKYAGTSVVPSQNQVEKGENVQVSEQIHDEVKETHGFKVGDRVKQINTSKIMPIIEIKGNNITCETGFFSGIATFDASELELVKE